MSSLRIEPLSRRHRPLLGDFCNQEPSLVRYLKQFALRHSERDLLSRTFLAIHEERGAGRLAGYFSLSTVSVERERLEGVEGIRGLPRFPVPGILLARLAVDERAQGQGLGRYLFEEALGRVLVLARGGPVAFRLFVTDAISENAGRFYRQFGFEPLSDDWSNGPVRMVLDLKPLLEMMSGEGGAG